MALSDAILVCLTDGPTTGYDLAKRFDASVGFFWKAEHQQIYRELAKLRERGFVSGREVVQTDRPNKMVYTLTPAGREALRAWARRPSVPSTTKDDLLLRLYALDEVDVEPIRTDIMARLEYHGARLARFKRILEKRFASGAKSRSELGMLLGLRMGLRYERAVVEWCEEALQELSSTGTVVPFEQAAAASGSSRTGDGPEEGD